MSDGSLDEEHFAWARFLDALDLPASALVRLFRVSLDRERDSEAAWLSLLTRKEVRTRNN